MGEETIPSVRNLEEGFATTPLRDFTGVLDSLPTEPARGYEGTRVNINFKELEVLKSVEPYNFPTVTLNMGLSNKAKSKYGYLASSVAALIPPDEDFKEQIGRRMHLVFCDGLEGRPEPKPIWSRDADKTKFANGEIPTQVWICTSIEGVAGPAATSSAVDEAKKALDGRTMSEFNKLALAVPAIRADKELQRAIIDKSFVKGLVATGAFSKDENDIYHRAK